MSARTYAISLSMLFVLLASCQSVRPPAPGIAFLPYGADYTTKPDFAQVEFRYPLTTPQLAALQPEQLDGMEQEQLDQLYARLTAGRIPDGAYRGRVVRVSGAAFSTVAEMSLSLKGLRLGDVVDVLWTDKAFDREARVARANSASGLTFPAKVYCGQSLLDARRESIVVDHLFADDIADYREMPEHLAGRRGLRVRNEIRMVRDGFYLGRAYVDRVFVLNFTLYNAGVAKLREVGRADECWVGSAAHRVENKP